MQTERAQNDEGNLISAAALAMSKILQNVLCHACGVPVTFAHLRSDDEALKGAGAMRRHSESLLLLAESALL